MESTNKRPLITIGMPRLSRLTFITTTPKRIPPERPPPPRITNYDNNNNADQSRRQPTPLAFLNKPPLPPKPQAANNQPPPLPPKKNTGNQSSYQLSQPHPSPITPHQQPPPPRPSRVVAENFPVNGLQNQTVQRQPLPSSDCLNCRDFTFVDRHAANFPRRGVTSLQSLAHNLTNGFPSKTDKARAIFIWLHHNIAYDTEALLGRRVRGKSPEDTLQSGLAVCQGYAELFEILGRYSGLEAMVISGHGKGYGYKPSSGQQFPQFKSNHAWNGVRLESGDWHLIDSCWGAGHCDDKMIYIKKLNTVHFTSSPEQFGIRHFPKDPRRQFCSRQISWNEYLQRDGPIVYCDFMDKGLSQESIQPQSRTIQPGRTRFAFKSKCDHVSIPPQEQYVLLLTIDGIMTPFQEEFGKIWTCEAIIKPGSNVSVSCVDTLNDRDAKGVGVKAYQKSVGRAPMSFRGLCRWDVANL